MAKKQTGIFSIFGQIEEAAANYMVEHGKANKIEADMIPDEAKWNENGDRAKFAIVIEAAHILEFQKTIRNMRA